MTLIDTHSHLYLEEFDEDRAAVMERALACGVDRIILPAIDLKTLDRLLQMCQAYPEHCFPLLGLHPEELDTSYAQVLDQMKPWLNREDSPFIGIGEVGLDFYWDQTYKKEQFAAFETQIEWAIQYDLPLVIHARAAHHELVSTLFKYKEERLRGIFHCFSGTEDECQELLAFPGFYIGVGGILTFKKSTLPQVLQHVPLERIVVETDAPYMAPVPHRGKRNESAFVRDTAERLAQVKEITLEEVARITTQNAEKLFFSRKK